MTRRSGTEPVSHAPECEGWDSTGMLGDEEDDGEVAVK